MTERERHIAWLQAQIQCAEHVNENHIGQLVWVRDEIKEDWEGPFKLEGFYMNKDGLPYKTRNEYDYNTDWRFATLTPPAPKPTNIELIPWEGGKCPVQIEQPVLLRRRSGALEITWQHGLLLDEWAHTFDNRMFHIVAYLPVNITVKGESV